MKDGGGGGAAAGAGTTGIAGGVGVRMPPKCCSTVRCMSFLLATARSEGERVFPR